MNADAASRIVPPCGPGGIRSDRERPLWRFAMRSFIMRAMRDRDFQRALWRSRRGMLELDLVLVEFARNRYSELTAAQRRAYLELLELDDWTIWDWLRGQPSGEPTPVRLAPVVRLIARSLVDG